MSKIRFGVIGTGVFADICHIPCLKAHPSAEVVAVCGRRREKAAALAAKYGVAGVYDDYRKLIASGTVDAVTIVTPNDTHAEIAIAALNAGLHVFCEKPLAMDAGQARNMTDAARRSGKVAIVGFTFRYLIGLRRMRAMIADGAIGKPYYVRGWSREYRLIGPKAVACWKQQAARAGTGVLGDLGSHMLDVVRYAVGPVAEVCGNLVNVPRQVPDENGVPLTVDADDAAAFLFRTASGLNGDIFASWATPTHDRRTIEVVGSEGALLCNLTRGEDELLRLVRAGKATRDAEVIPLPLEAPPDQPSGIFRMMRAFVDAVLRGKPGPDDATFADGLATQQVVDGVVESVKKRGWVTVV